MKFKLTPKQKIDLIEDAEFISKETFTDVYYDTCDYKLSLNDTWLRSRNEDFLLKVPIQAKGCDLLKAQKNTPKKEIPDVIEIKKALGLKNPDVSENFRDDLNLAGYLPLYKYQNIREKYLHNQFIIDFDRATWNNNIFEICEIEILVESEQKIPQALDQIKNFAIEKNLTIAPVEARLIEIIKIQNPDHYQKLKAKLF